MEHDKRAKTKARAVGIQRCQVLQISSSPFWGVFVLCVERIHNILSSILVVEEVYFNHQEEA